MMMMMAINMTRNLAVWNRVDRHILDAPDANGSYLDELLSSELPNIIETPRSLPNKSAKTLRFAQNDLLPAKHQNQADNCHNIGIPATSPRIYHQLQAPQQITSGMILYTQVIPTLLIKTNNNKLYKPLASMT
ncbi:unnamed protein product [Arctogadus glacialis]